MIYIIVYIIYIYVNTQTSIAVILYLQILQGDMIEAKTTAVASPISKKSITPQKNSPTQQNHSWKNTTPLPHPTQSPTHPTTPKKHPLFPTQKIQIKSHDIHSASDSIGRAPKG